MNGLGWTGWAAAAVGLCGLIGLEITGRDGDADAALVRPAPIMVAGGPSAAAVPRDQRDGRLGVILARPLFSPDRRPAASAARSVSGLPRLTGIVVTGSRKVAIFAAPGKAIVAEEGLHVGAYDVTAISDSGVTVVGPEGTTVLRPLFDPATPAVAKAPVMQRSAPPK
jgi:hypothetical protein